MLNRLSRSSCTVVNVRHFFQKKMWFFFNFFKKDEEMFFWLIAIPFFVIIAMFTLFRLPSSDLNQPEEMQDAAMAFRMAMQHDAAAKLMQEYQGSSESDMFDEGSYDLGGDTWKETILESGYLPSSFIPDTDNITTYVRCVNGLRQIASCRGAKGIYMITAATPPSGESITARWFEQKGAQNLATQLNKYEGSFPVKQGGLVLPRKPRKEEDESDEDFAIRLNAYKETKAQYKLLKRNYYDFGNKLPRPNTVVGEVRAYPFNDESAESRVILTRMKVIEGEVHFDSELMPTDLPVGGEGSDSLDFNGEAVILTASFKQPDPCVTDEDCFSGAPYCNAGICGTTKPCSSDSDCSVASIPYCVTDMCAPFNAGTMVYEVNNITTASLSTPVAQVGEFTIPVAGKYQIRLMGEAGGGTGYYTWAAAGAGGVLITNTVLAKGVVLTIKGIKMGVGNGGAGVALWDTIDTTDKSPVLVAGGGGSGHAAGGGGYNGGYAQDSYGETAAGYSWNGILGNSQVMASATSPTAMGGAWNLSSNYCGYGGTGYCGSLYTCAQIAGGNASWTAGGYSAANYGNQSAASAAIVYCGPSADSPCPEGCGNGVGCATGSCNYKTGLCQ